MVDKEESKSNGLAIAAMVLGICGFAILPIIFGAVQLSKIKKGEASGKGMAIAGLVIGIVRLVLAVVVIILTIFVFSATLPTLPGSQRDTSRKDDYAAIASAITSYQSNNNGKLPSASSSDTFVKNYLTGLYDPGTFLPYNVIIRENSVKRYSSVDVKKGEVIIETGAGYDCNGSYVESQRAYRIIGYLETAGTYCADN